MAKPVLQYSGYKELIQGLEELPTEVAVRVAREGVAVAARDYRKTARRLAPRQTGTLRKGISIWQPPIRKAKFMEGAIARVRIAPPGMAKSKIRLNYYNLIERGRAAGGTDKRGRKLGSFRAQRFWAKTMSQQKRTATTTMLKASNVALVRFATRLHLKTIRAGRF